MNRPNSCTNLVKAINRLAGDGRDPLRLSRALANVVVAQMLPDGVVKGGSSLMFRYGGDMTRYTRDMDTARVMELDAYLDKLEARLNVGWNGFSGRLQKVEPPHPTGVPQAYVMVPYDIKLSYNGRPWQTVRIEIGHNEIGDANEAEMAVPADMAEAFAELGFPDPNPVPVMKLPYQIAQKLHAVTSEGADRPHDLVDLQLVCANSEVDLAETKAICVRLSTIAAVSSGLPRLSRGRCGTRFMTMPRGDWTSCRHVTRRFHGLMI